MNPDLSDTIRRLIRELISEHQDQPDMKELQRTAAKYELLPLGFNWDPCCITPTGDVVVFSWDNHEDYRIETDQRVINGILYQGIKKYPELNELMPVRTENDPECYSCHGTGILPFAAANDESNIVCFCGGLGWLPGKKS
jgi:hypothetical protein